jgi:hypothetical protein
MYKDSTEQVCQFVLYLPPVCFPASSRPPERLLFVIVPYIGSQQSLGNVCDSEAPRGSRDRCATRLHELCTGHSAGAFSEWRVKIPGQSVHIGRSGEGSDSCRSSHEHRTAVRAPLTLMCVLFLLPAALLPYHHVRTLSPENSPAWT